MSIRDIVGRHTTMGGGGGLLFKPKTGKSFPRLYRFKNEEDKKELLVEKWQHFRGQGIPPLPCTLGETGSCEMCSTCEALKAAGDKESKDKANNWRRQGQMLFVVVDTQEPEGFQMWQASSSQGRQVILMVAQAGGWLGEAPDAIIITEEDPEPSPELVAEWDKYEAAFDLGLEQVCGPDGRDICVTYNPKAAAVKRYSFQLVEKVACKTLPFPEVDVTTPAEIQAQLDELRAAKKNK